MWKSYSKPPRSYRRASLHDFIPPHTVDFLHRSQNPFLLVLGVRLLITLLLQYYSLSLTKPTSQQLWQLQHPQLPASASSQWACPSLNCKGPSVLDSVAQSTSVLPPVSVPVRSRQSKIAFQKLSVMRKLHVTIFRIKLIVPQLEKVCALKAAPCPERLLTKYPGGRGL